LANVGGPAVVLDMRESASRSLHQKSGKAKTLCLPSRGSIAARTHLYVCIDPLVGTHRIRINTLAPAARLPTMHGSRESSKRQV
jgi:hypothetical protein